MIEIHLLFVRKLANSSLLASFSASIRQISIYFSFAFALCKGLCEISFMKRALVFLLYSMPITALAETNKVSPLKSDYMGNLLLSLGLVVGLIFALAWLVKRFNFIPQQNQGLIKVLSTLSLSSRDRIALIEVGEEQILVSLTPGNITKLHSLKTPINMPEQTDATFKNKFQSVVNDQLNKTNKIKEDE